MRKNTKAGIKLFLRNSFDRFRKPRTARFVRHPESFEANWLLLLRDLNHKMLKELCHGILSCFLGRRKLSFIGWKSLNKTLPG